MPCETNGVPRPRRYTHPTHRNHAKKRKAERFLFVTKKAFTCMEARGAVRAATLAIRLAPILEKDASEAILLGAFPQATRIDSTVCLSVGLETANRLPKECRTYVKHRSRTMNSLRHGMLYTFFQLRTPVPPSTSWLAVQVDVNLRRGRKLPSDERRLRASREGRKFDSCKSSEAKKAGCVRAFALWSGGSLAEAEALQGVHKAKI